MRDDDIDDASIIEGGTDARAKIMAWIKPIVQGPETESEVLVSLYQKSKLGEKSIDEFLYELGAGQSLDAFVGEIVDMAENDAAEMFGTIRYSIRIKGKTGRCAFALKVPRREGTEDDEEPDENPDGKGLVHQAMRHAEVFAREMLASARVNNGMLMGMLRDVREENIHLKTHQVEQIKITEQLRNMQFERDMKRDELKESKERKRQAMAMLMKAAPVIASKVLGGGAQLAQNLGASPVDGLLEGLVTSLEAKPETLNKLIAMLDPLDAAAFIELHNYVKQKQGAGGGSEGGGGEGGAQAAE